VVLEAMAAGCNVVASRVGGIPEMVDEGRTGRLVPPGDPTTLSKVMLELYRSAEQRDRLGRAAREVANSWRMERTVEQYHALYRRMRDE
jgi:glycosyltransferase involved in cell wall biosynthesis